MGGGNTGKLPPHNPGWGQFSPYLRTRWGGSTGAMGGEADRNLDSLLYSHRLPLVVHLDMTYPCESHKFVSLGRSYDRLLVTDYNFLDR